MLRDHSSIRLPHFFCHFFFWGYSVFISWVDKLLKAEKLKSIAAPESGEVTETLGPISVLLSRLSSSWQMVSTFYVALIIFLLKKDHEFHLS